MYNNIGKWIETNEKAKEEEIPFDFLGEKITYDIKLGMISLGSAVFHHQAKTELNGKNADLVTFNTKVTRFNDLETIYSDSDTFLPVKIERDIRTLTSREKITEDYDQEKFRVTINKFKGKKKQEILIQKKGTIHNAVMLPFYMRRQPALQVGWAMETRLPVQDFLMRLVCVEKIKVPAGTFMAYRFESTPEKFHIWITADSRRIPVKIIGNGKIGYALVMKNYSLGK